MTYEFEACRASGDGNAVFPDELIIDTDEEVVIHRKHLNFRSRATILYA